MSRDTAFADLKINDVVVTTQDWDMPQVTISTIYQAYLMRSGQGFTRVSMNSGRRPRRGYHTFAPACWCLGRCMD